MRWATTRGVAAIAVEDRNFTDSTTREKHGRRKKFRQLISGMPTARLRSRLVSMAHTLGVASIAIGRRAQGVSGAATDGTAPTPPE